MNYTKVFGITALGMLLMSFESPLIKMTHVNAQTFIFYFGLCMFFSMNLTLCVKYRKSIFNLYSRHFSTILLSGLFTGLSNFFFILAIKHTSVASAVFILSTGPLVSAIIAFLLFRQRTPQRTFVAIFFVLIGLSIILLNDLQLGNMKGNLYAFGCVFAFISMLLVLEQNKEVNRLACFGIGTLIASFLASISAPIAVPDGFSLGIIFFTGFLLTPLSRTFIGIGTKFLSSVEIALLTIIEPVFAPFWVWILMGEKPHMNVLVGGVIIIFALIIHTLMAYKEAKLNGDPRR